MNFSYVVIRVLDHVRRGIPMTYPGNSSLSQEIRQRILGTFEQTLQLAEKGTRQEALLGCDFILRRISHYIITIR